MEITPNDWLKSKGYLHITPQLNIYRKRERLISDITNQEFISSYNFYPLIHTNIINRRYKKQDNNTRSHTSLNEKGEVEKNVKIRPLHYATHFDSLIFGYYAKIIQSKYDDRLKLYKNLSDCIIAYRKILSGVEDKNKGTAHFAKEIFEEIENRVKLDGNCIVLTFDIKGFFPSLNHSRLKKIWSQLLERDNGKLPPDHYNVFKAATNFSYILLDELKTSGGKIRKGFDEKRLHEIRKEKGFNAFFESAKDFRQQVKEKKLRIYPNCFRNEKGEKVGIPQGLPISATLANLYLWEFDKSVYDTLVDSDYNAFYRRYSDDIIVLCKTESEADVQNFILEEIKKVDLKISVEKTEKYIFKEVKYSNGKNRITSIRVNKSQDGKTEISCSFNQPLVYLGFEFYGFQTLIKSTNLAKFYRKIINAVKQKARRAFKESANTNDKPVIFRNQLYEKFLPKSNSNRVVNRNYKYFKSSPKGGFELKVTKRKKKIRGNYIKYLERTSAIIGDNRIMNQVKKYKGILNKAIDIHFFKVSKNR